MSWTNSLWFRLLTIAAVVVVLIANVIEQSWAWAALAAAVLAINLGGLYRSRRRQPVGSLVQ